MGKTLTEIAEQLSTPKKVQKTVPEKTKVVEDAIPVPKVQLIYAFNGTGKTRLSRKFKKLIAPKPDDGEEAGQPELSRNKILYYNALTEDLFYWDNDLVGDGESKLKIQPNTFTDWVLKDQGQDMNVITTFQRYTNDKLTPHFNVERIEKGEGDKQSTIKAFSEVTFTMERGQNFGDESISPLVELLAQRLGPQAVEAPTLARQLLAAAAMFDGTKPLTRGTAARLEGFSSSVDREVLDMVTSITGTDGLQSTIARIQAIPSATNDVGRNSFMESVLKVTMSSREKRSLAALVDDAGLKTSTKGKLIEGLASVFGDVKTAQTVVDYYGKRRRAAFKAEAEANKLLEDRPNPQDDIKYQGDITQTAAAELSDEQTEKAAEFNELTENGEPPNSYKFRDAGKLRPYRAFAKRGNTEGGMNKRSKESTLAMIELKRNSPDSARVRPINYSQYVDDMGLDRDQELRRIVNDTEKLLIGEERRHSPKDDRSAKIDELKGQIQMIDLTYQQGGSQAALDLFEVLQVSQVDKNDQVADDDTVAKYVGILGKTRDPKKPNKARGETRESIKAENKAITDTTITFIKTNGSKIAMSAESMWKTQGDKKEKVGSSKGESSKKRILRLFKDAVNAMLARTDIKGIVDAEFSFRAPFVGEGKPPVDLEKEPWRKVLTGKLPENLLIDRESGARTPTAKTKEQKVAAAIQREENAKENARRDRLDAERKRLAGVEVEAEVSTRRTPEDRTPEAKKRVIEKQKQDDAREDARAKTQLVNLSSGPKARRAELQERLDEFEAVLTAEKSNSNQIDVAEQLDEIMQPLRDAAVLAGQRMSDAKAELKLAKQNDAPKSEQYKLQTDFELAREAFQDIRDTLEDMEGLQFEDSRDRNEDDRKGTTTEETLGPVGYKGMPRTIMNEQDSDNGEVRFFEADTGAGIAKERGTRTGGKLFAEVTASESTDYPQRTRANVAAAELTAHFAIDYTTKGELLTKSTAEEADKYLATPLDTTVARAAKQLIAALRDRGATTLNVAGNGLYTLDPYTGPTVADFIKMNEDRAKAREAFAKLDAMGQEEYTKKRGLELETREAAEKKAAWTQEKINQYVTDVLAIVHRKIGLTKIVSGGQTGVDMAGAVAAQVLGIPAVITLPKNFTQRGRDGKDSPHTKKDIEQQILSGAVTAKQGLKAQANTWSAPDNVEQPFESKESPPLRKTNGPEGTTSRLGGDQAVAPTVVPGKLGRLIASGDARVHTRKNMYTKIEHVVDTVLVYNAKNTTLLAGTMPDGTRYVNTGKLRDEGIIPYIKNSPMLMRVMEEMGLTPEQLDAQLGNRARRLSFLIAREESRTEEKSLRSETRATFLALTTAELAALLKLGPRAKKATLSGAFSTRCLNK